MRTVVERTVPLATLLPAAADDNALALQPVAQHAASALELEHRVLCGYRPRPTSIEGNSAPVGPLDVRLFLEPVLAFRLYATRSSLEVRLPRDP